MSLAVTDEVPQQSAPAVGVCSRREISGGFIPSGELLHLLMTPAQLGQRKRIDVGTRGCDQDIQFGPIAGGGTQRRAPAPTQRYNGYG